MLLVYTDKRIFIQISKYEKIIWRKIELDMSAQLNVTQKWQQKLIVASDF
jgi:hypothetical protein